MSSRAAIGGADIQLQAGFTLLEMLVVISLLAAVASIATGTFSGIVGDAQDRLVRTEMLEIAGAIRQFRADTGFYPKTGPFNLVDSGGKVSESGLPESAGSTSAEKQRWFYSPANFHQLLVEPQDGEGDPVAEWDPESGRGWRGPYLKGFSKGYVDIGDGINSGVNGEKLGDPLDGTTVEGVSGLPDPYSRKPLDGLLGWWRLDEDDEKEVMALGRPYLLFDLGGDPLLISMGEDGQFDWNSSDNGDDVLLYIDGLGSDEDE